MSLSVFWLWVVSVCRSHDFQSIFLCQLDQLGANDILFIDMVPLYLDIKIFFSENADKPLDKDFSQCCVALAQCSRNGAGKACAEADDAFVIPFQHIPRHMGLHLEVVKGFGGQFE